jgi:hypothetical protein
MNVWEWVGKTQDRLREEGSPASVRLATLMEEVPNYLSDEAHSKLDAAIPEAVALAKAAKLPWVEVFFRHWELQSRILCRFEGERALPDAVALVDFSHAEGQRECPQSVCTVQDLGVAYSIVDGPGYHDERRAVAEETLARIDPSWDCFVCISSEYASARIDAGSVEEALQFVEAQESKRIAAGQPVRGSSFWGDRVNAHLALGEPQKALVALDACADYQKERSRYPVARARVLAELGRFEEAQAAMPPFSQIEANPEHYERWAETMELMVLGGATPNSTGLGVALERFSAMLEGNGSFRIGFSTSMVQARLALKRGATASVRQTLRRMRRRASRLRPLPIYPEHGKAKRPEEPTVAIANVHAELALLMQTQTEAWRSARADASPTPASVLSELRERDTSEDSPWESSEARLAFVEAGYFALSTERSEALVLAYGEALLGLYLLEDAREVLEPIAYSGSPARLAYASVLREAQDSAGTQAMVARLLAEAAGDASVLIDAHFIDALFQRHVAAKAKTPTEQKDAHLRAISAFEQVIALDNSVLNTRRMAAASAEAAGDHALALGYYDAIATRGGHHGGDQWERILLGTRLGAWRKVRESCAALDIKLEEVESPDAPIDEAWTYCRIRFGEDFASDVDDDRKPRDTYALRTGPATAVIRAMASPTSPQFYGCTVLLRPQPIEEPEANEEDRDYLYPALAVLSRKPYVFHTVDGIHPGDEHWAKLRAQVAEAGGELQRHSGDAYKLIVDDKEVQGIYGTLAIPAAAADEPGLARFHQLLIGAEGAEGLVWLSLAAAAGDTEAASKQEARAEALGL